MKIKINRIRTYEYIFLIVCFCMVIPPLGINSVYAHLYSGISFLGSLIVIFGYLGLKKVSIKDISPGMIAIAFYLIWNIGLTLVLETTINSLAVRTLLVAFSLLFLLSRTKSQNYLGLKALRDYLFIIVILNMIMELLYFGGFTTDRRGWQDIYLLGNANSYVFTFLLALSAENVYSLLEYKKIGKRGYILVFAEWISFYLGGESTSAAGMLCVTLYLLMMVAIRSRFVRAMFGFGSKRAFILILCVLTLFIVMVNTSTIYQLLEFIGIEQTDIGTFGSRVYIWRQAISRILESPVIGHGVVNGNFALSATGALRSGHNNFLQILYYSGIIGLSLYFASIALIIKKIRKCLGLDETLSIIYFIGILLYVLAFLVEQSPFSCEFIAFLVIGVFIENNYRHVCSTIEAAPNNKVSECYDPLECL